MDFSALNTISGATPIDQLTSEQVKELQTALAALGYGLTVDGICGPLTQSAWARFKADNDQSDPTLIGPASVTLLEGRLAGAPAGTVPQQAVNIVKSFEGCELTAYQDSVGVWTIGFGTTVLPDGTPVAQGLTITASQALEYLAHDLGGTLNALAASAPYWATMNADQQSALISFGYNLGAGFYGAPGFTTITAALRDHQWSDVPSILQLYSDPGGSDHDGLLRRRIAEGELWQGTGSFASPS
jgi:GH24 family phage-related lysozyme (muramidase)